MVSNTLCFDNVDYSLSLIVGEDTLALEAMDLEKGDLWAGTFHAEYIEELSEKTGNFKDFETFSKMLESSILQDSNSVGLELLTYSHLEALRSKKAGEHPKSINRNSNNNSKRYLIMTYTSEFDKTHYPLPLGYDGPPDPVALRQKISSLKSELEEARLSSSFARDASIDLGSKKKNEEYKKLYAQYCALEKERSMLRDELHEERKACTAIVRLEKSKYTNTLSKKNAEIQNLKKALFEEKDRCSVLKKELDRLKASSRTRTPSANRGQTSRTTGTSLRRPATRTTRRSSSSSRPRFNPTEYVRQKEEKMQRRRSRSTGGMSRSSSVESFDSSCSRRSSTSYREQQRSVERLYRGASPRTRSAERTNDRLHKTPSPKYPISKPLRKKVDPRKYEEEYIIYHAQPSSGTRRAKSPFKSSPIRVPSAVRQQEGENENDPHVIAPNVIKDTYKEAASEISNIDSRLMALQNFLKTAKQTSQS
eukprot:Nk52_evm25s248 gene=Nk52_evmTU25s248